MTARPSDRPEPPAPRRSVAVTDLSALREPSPPRVVSLSPTDRDRPGGENPTEAAFLTPRVIDESTVKNLAATIRTLIDDAQRAGRDLEARIEAAGAAQAPATETGTQLRERLRVGARMLKAFQVQIDRVDGAVGDLTSREESLRAADAALEENLESFRSTLEEARSRGFAGIDAVADAAIARATRRIDEQLERIPDDAAIARQITDSLRSATESFARRMDEREARIPSVEDLERCIDEHLDEARHQLDADLVNHRARAEAAEARVAELETRLAELGHAMETSEVDVAALTNRVATNRKETTARLDEIEAALTDGRGAVRELEERARGAEAAQAQLAARLDECAKAERRIATASEKLTALIGRFEPLAERCQRIETVLERLEPWRSLLLEADQADDGTPLPAAQLVETLRTGIADDMASLSATMRELAHRVEKYQGEPREAPIITSERDRTMRFKDHVEGA